MSEPTIVTDCCVFRIEDDNGVGPFRSSIKVDHATAWDMLRAHTPMKDLRQEFCGHIAMTTTRHYAEFICGYHSIKHLRKYWSQESLDKVIDKGFIINKIFVKECWLTDDQCIFLPENIIEKQKIKIQY